MREFEDDCTERCDAVEETGARTRYNVTLRERRIAGPVPAAKKHRQEKKRKPGLGAVVRRETLTVKERQPERSSNRLNAGLPTRERCVYGLSVDASDEWGREEPESDGPELLGDPER